MQIGQRVLDIAVRDQNLIDVGGNRLPILRPVASRLALSRPRLKIGNDTPGMIDATRLFQSVRFGRSRSRTPRNGQ